MISKDDAVFVSSSTLAFMYLFNKMNRKCYRTLGTSLLSTGMYVRIVIVNKRCHNSSTVYFKKNSADQQVLTVVRININPLSTK